MDRLRFAFGFVLLLVLVVIVFAAGFFPAFFGGLAWGIFVGALAAWLIQHFLLRDHGGGGIGEGLLCLALMAVVAGGVITGLIMRWVWP